jgi:tetratricopeptide (TPR) repeat protein
MRLGAVTCVLGAALALASVAHAQPTPTEIQAARDLFNKAEADEDAGRWADALDKVKRASSVKPTPGLRFHMALCEEKLGQLVAALADYTAAEQMAREQNNKDVLDAVAEPLKTLRIRVPTLTIEVPPAQGAQIELDGNPIAPGLFGVAMPVEPGTHRVSARAPGKRLFSTQVTLHEREAETTTVRWTDAPPLPSEAGEGGEHETPAPSPKETPSSPVKVGAILATVSSVALLGLGVGAYVAADGAHGDLVAQCPSLTNCDDLRTKVRAWDAVALGSWIASAGVAVLAIVLWATPSKPASASARLELRPGGLAVSGRF